MGVWLAQSAEHVTLGLRVVDSSPIMGVEITLKKKLVITPNTKK